MLIWGGYLFWALFVNACNVWMIKPLVQDFSILGVAAVMAIVALWWTSLPRSSRRKWVTFTLFSLFLGDGISELTLKSPFVAVSMGILMVLGLIVVAWWFARVRVRFLFATSILLVLANLALPVDEWPFLTHFWITYHKSLHMQTTDMTAPPLSVIQTTTGNAVVSLNNIDETDAQLQKIAETEGDSNDSLENLLRNYGHRYEFVELVQQNGHFQIVQLPAKDLGSIEPLQFDNSFFPFMRAFWSQQGNQVVQYMAPAQSPRTVASIVNEAGNVPTNLNALGAETQNQELADWKRLLGSSNVSVKAHLMVIEGHLVGPFEGKTVNIPVTGSTVLAMGSFTTPNVHEVLIGGANMLQVVSLDRGKVVSTYHGQIANPLPNDVVVGPLDNSGRDSIFVNASPAFILQANETDTWRTLYKAPNVSLRFEAAVKFAGDNTPEIITDDPSVMRNSPTRYLSSYTYRDGQPEGQLYRNWRVYRTNVENLHTVQFTPDGPTYLVLATYLSGKIFVLSRHDLPVMPTTVGLLGLIVLAGWMTRLRRKGVTSHA